MTNSKGETQSSHSTRCRSSGQGSALEMKESTHHDVRPTLDPLRDHSMKQHASCRVSSGSVTSGEISTVSHRCGVRTAGCEVGIDSSICSLDAVKVQAPGGNSVLRILHSRKILESWGHGVVERRRRSGRESDKTRRAPGRGHAYRCDEAMNVPIRQD